MGHGGKSRRPVEGRYDYRGRNSWTEPDRLDSSCDRVWVPSGPDESSSGEVSRSLPSVTYLWGLRNWESAKFRVGCTESLPEAVTARGRQV